MLLGEYVLSCLFGNVGLGPLPFHMASSFRLRTHLLFIEVNVLGKCVCIAAFSR